MSPTQLPKKGGSASRRDASSSSANLIARLRGRVFLFVFLVGEGKKPVSQWRGASLSQKLRRLSKWFPGLFYGFTGTNGSKGRRSVMEGMHLEHFECSL